MRRKIVIEYESESVQHTYEERIRHTAEDIPEEVDEVRITFLPRKLILLVPSKEPR